MKKTEEDAVKLRFGEPVMLYSAGCSFHPHILDV
jgi:hypothetical protein